MKALPFARIIRNMTETLDVSTRNAQWDKFLAKWPLECLSTMELAQYTQAGNRDVFQNWLEIQTEDLGSVWGGSAFKFGIYSRANKVAKVSGEGLSYSADFAWYTKYGSTPETAWVKIRSIVSEVADAARRGDVQTIEEADLGTIIKWKLAFLYQDRTAPKILPIYAPERLQWLSGETAKLSVSALHQQLMRESAGGNVFQLATQLQERWDGHAATLLTKDQALGWLRAQESLSPAKDPTSKLAAFRDTEGRELALTLDNVTPVIYVSDGDWLDNSVRGRLKALGVSVRSYSAEESRSSSLAANAPSLAVGHRIVHLKVSSLRALELVFNSYMGDGVVAASSKIMSTNVSTFAGIPKMRTLPPLNQILCGPPGTGKTYSTVTKALEILEPEWMTQLAAEPADFEVKRQLMKQRFDTLHAQGRVQFTTFHQSFSYEDFVEGLRAVSDESTGQLRYEVVDGVFKSLCEVAQVRVTQQAVTPLELGNRRVWKMSLGNTLGSDASIYDECVRGGYVLLGYGGGIDFTGCHSRKDVEDRYSVHGIQLEEGNDYRVTSVATFVLKIQIGDLIVVSDGNLKFRAIAEVTSDYEYTTRNTEFDGYAQRRKVKWLRQYSPSLPYSELLSRQFSQMTLYALQPPNLDKEKLQGLLGAGPSSNANFPFSIGQIIGSGYEVLRVSDDLIELRKPSSSNAVLPIPRSLIDALVAYVREGSITVEDIRQKQIFEKVPNAPLEKYLVNGYGNVLAALAQVASQSPTPASQEHSNDARVLVIDEINRGNVSRIFGELITLIEHSKRAGASEALSVVLPYSKEKFSVPGNVYIIGTMNTTDRSLAGIDVALRRRFDFEELMPDPEVLRGVVVKDDATGLQVNVDAMLSAMNERIEALLDREHQLGHAYFMPLRDDPTLECLAQIFRQRVVPLLQEYFFDDWERIALVLNDHRKRKLGREELCFVVEHGRSLQALFGDGLQLPQGRKRWRINSEAFEDLASFAEIESFGEKSAMSGATDVVA